MHIVTTEACLFCYARYRKKSTVKLKTTFSQYLLEALLPWHLVGGNPYNKHEARRLLLFLR